jgi:hypothetical protein
LHVRTRQKRKQSCTCTSNHEQYDLTLPAALIQRSLHIMSGWHLQLVRVVALGAVSHVLANPTSNVTLTENNDPSSSKVSLQIWVRPTVRRRCCLTHLIPGPNNSYYRRASCPTSLEQFKILGQAGPRDFEARPESGIWHASTSHAKCHSGNCGTADRTPQWELCHRHDCYSQPD